MPAAGHSLQPVGKDNETIVSSAKNFESKVTQCLHDVVIRISDYEPLYSGQ